MDVKCGMKRSRKAWRPLGASQGENTLCSFLVERQWDKAIDHVRRHPGDVLAFSDPSALALACRYGAPYECVQVILEAAPEKLRVLLDARGTPLHEAVGSLSVGLDVIEMLVKADEALGTDTTRACLLQDVDGFTPLHVLFRRCFQSINVSRDDDTMLLRLLELLVRSCPEAVVVPDHGEYKEPPIVYAIKADTYAFRLTGGDQVENLVYRLVECLLKYCPKAASWVFAGFRGPYSALHSAVFHGRRPETIGLLLRVEAEHPSELSARGQRAALVTNSQGETPLHFCAMKGERAKSLALLAQAAPKATLMRDATGLTPLHWLWFRFVSKLLKMETLNRADERTDILTTRYRAGEMCTYSEFAMWKHDGVPSTAVIEDWDHAEDFLRMRHIPLSVLGTDDNEDSWSWPERTAEVLRQVRERYLEIGSDTSIPDTSVRLGWTRRQVITSLFWTKVVSLLKAAQEAAIDGSSNRRTRNDNDLRLVHTAFGSPSCCPSVAKLVASLFPEEMAATDCNGRLPVHHAARRPWHAWDWAPSGVAGGTSEDVVPGQMPDYPPAGPILLRRESLHVLREALALSDPATLGVTDNDGRLVLHDVIGTFVQASMNPAMSRSTDSSIKTEMLATLHRVVQMNPSALSIRDGISKLYPFLQATAESSQPRRSDAPNDLSLSITYQLLRENPTVLQMSRHQ